VFLLLPLKFNSYFHFFQLGGLILVNHLKHHFNVSNSYVIRKLRLVVFPWRHKPWTRKLRRSETGISEFQPPRDDLNAPDLYIPSNLLPFRCIFSLLTSIASLLAMAFVTYILLAALQSGLQSRFHPEIFGLVATRAIVVLLLDFLFVKGGCYLLGVQASSPIVDLLAYGGYKFVGCVAHLNGFVVKLNIFRVIATLMVGLVGLSRTLYSVAFVYTFLANAFFLVRTRCSRTYTLIMFFAAPLVALCRLTRRRCNPRGRWDRLSRTTIPAYHIPVSRCCRTDLIHGCIGPRIVCGIHSHE
jgi:hypothetical protein